MSALISQITSAGYADRVLSDQQIGRILGGSDDRRCLFSNKVHTMRPTRPEFTDRDQNSWPDQLEYTYQYGKQ